LGGDREGNSSNLPSKGKGGKFGGKIPQKKKKKNNGKRGGDLAALW